MAQDIRSLIARDMVPSSNMVVAQQSPSQVLFIHPSDDLYGADILILEILKRLDRSKYEPLVVLPEDMKHVQLLSRELEAASIEYCHLPILILRRRYFKPQAFFALLRSIFVGSWMLRRLMRKKNVKLIHSSSSAVIAAPIIAWLTGTRLVAHIQEMVVSPHLVRKANHFAIRQTANRVICISNSVRDHFLKDQPRAAGIVRVVRNGIPLPEAPKRTAEEIRSELEVGENVRIIGMIARISPWKGQEVFARAAALLRSRGVACKFIAIGSVFDNEREHLDRFLEVLHSLEVEEVVKIVEFRKDARELIAAFDVFVLPSTLPEPFGLVILEAMAVGKPVIATAHGGPLEIVVPEVTGLLIPPNDPEALAVAIERLLDHPDEARRFGEAGRKRLLEEFEMSEYIKRIEQVYAEVLFSPSQDFQHELKEDYELFSSR